LRAVISTAGRFHLFALARELQRRGALERIYSGFPWRVLARENLPREKVTTFPWFRVAFVARRHPALRLPQSVDRWFETMSCVGQDAFVARRLPECDVFIGHDATGLSTGREAQRRGYAYIADTGSCHLRSRRRMIEEEHRLYGVPMPSENQRLFDRMIEEYETADSITVPSTFVRNSFLEQGVSPSRINVIPYGVRTALFRPTSPPPQDVFRVLFVGNFCIRKGARYLLEAFRAFPHPKKELAIVGPVSDELRAYAAAVRDPDIRFVGVVPNAELNAYYSASHVMVLPSIEEGLALVMAEALACGCPVIASENTGAKDLFTHEREGFIVPVRDPAAIRDCLVRLADEPELRAHMSAAALERIQHIGGWEQYGDAYFDLISQRHRPVARPRAPDLAMISNGGRA
jgi:glycosyltransferase involved in cell wall biosynthesis